MATPASTSSSFFGRLFRSAAEEDQLACQEYRIAIHPSDTAIRRIAKDAKLVNFLATAGIDIEKRSVSGNDILGDALSNRRVEVVKAVLENVLAKPGKLSPLLKRVDTAWHSLNESVKNAVAACIGPYASSLPEKEVAKLWNDYRRYADKLQFIVKCRFNIDFPEANGRTPFMNHVKVHIPHLNIDFFLNSGASLALTCTESSTGIEKTILDLAPRVMVPDLKAAIEAAGKGAELELALQSARKKTAAAYISEPFPTSELIQHIAKDIEIIKELVKENANLFKKDERSQSLFDYASTARAADIVYEITLHSAKTPGIATQILKYIVDQVYYIEHNRSFFEAITSGLAPHIHLVPIEKQFECWHEANIISKFSLIKILVKSGCDINARNREGSTPFMEFLKTKYVDLSEGMREFLKNGASPLLIVTVGGKDKTVLDLAGAYRDVLRSMIDQMGYGEVMDAIVEEVRRSNAVETAPGVDPVPPRLKDALLDQELADWLARTERLIPKEGKEEKKA